MGAYFAVIYVELTFNSGQQGIGSAMLSVLLADNVKKGAVQVTFDLSVLVVVGLDSSVHADFFMVVQKFSFGEVTLISDDIAEVVANDGVEVTIEMIGEFHELLINQMSRPFMMLVNKRNCYSFTLEAQQYIYSLPDLYAVAVVAYNKVGEETAKGILNFSPPGLFHSKVFADRSSALEWLLTLQKEIKA